MRQLQQQRKIAHCQHQNRINPYTCNSISNKTMHNRKNIFNISIVTEITEKNGWAKK